MIYARLWGWGILEYLLNLLGVLRLLRGRLGFPNIKLQMASIDQPFLRTL